MTIPSIATLLFAIFVCVLAFANFETTLSLTVKGRSEPKFIEFTFAQICLTFAYIGFVLALVQGGVVRRIAGRVSEGTLRQRENTPVELERKARRERGTVWDLFANNNAPNVTVEVNKYIWNASLDVLNFLPVQSADPFSGVIVTGYGTPPGGGRAYRATIFVQDPALDARSLNLALQTRSGPAPRETVQAVEDAILTRARQLRIRDGRL